VGVLLRTLQIDNYRFGFNGMEKDNELKGLGNSLDFTARMYDSRLGRFLSLDPLYKKFPSESNYSFAGNNPIFNIDRDGKIKTTYWVIQDQTTGKTVFTTQRSPGLMKVPYNPSDGMGGSLGKSYDWYDYSVVNTLTINKAGQATFSTETVRGQYKTNTSAGWEWYAALKADDNKGKDKGKFGGWMLYSSQGGGSDNKFNPSAAKGSKMVDAGTVLQMFGRMNTIKGEQGVDGAIGMMKYLKDAVSITAGNQGDPDHPNLIKIGGDEEKSFSQCESCGSYKNNKTGEEMQAKDTSGKGITSENTSKQSLNEFHK